MVLVSPETMSQPKEEILAIERGFWTQADDPGFFEENIAEDGISVIEPMGVIEKEKAVKMTAKEPWETVEMSDVVVRQPAPNVAVVAYHGAGKNPQDGKPYRVSVASTYVRQDGRWRLAVTAHQPWAATGAKGKTEKRV
jgi:hypothetical protein